MSTVHVDVKLNNEGFIPLCKSAGVQAILAQEAERIAASANATTGQSRRNTQYRNENFVAVSKQLDRTAIARVSAANPRSDWYAKNRGALKP